MEHKFKHLHPPFDKPISGREALELLDCSKSHFYRVLVREYITKRIPRGRRVFYDRLEIEALARSGWR